MPLKHTNQSKIITKYNTMDLYKVGGMQEKDFDEDEGDAFYLELKRQILQLTDDDDDNNKVVEENRKQGNYNISPCVLRRSPSYYNWQVEDYNNHNNSKNNDIVPSWMMNLWRSSGNGTGVFIPQIMTQPPPRKNRSRNKRKKNESQTRYKKMVEKV